MTKLVAFVLLSTGLAIGCTSCAHEQLTARTQRKHVLIDRSALAGAAILGAMIEEQTR